jgi:predicted phage tail component-like protein
MAFTMTYGGVQLPIKIRQIDGRGPFRQDVTAQEMPGMAGAYFAGRKIKPRPLKIYYTIDNAISLEDLRGKADNLSSILNTDNPMAIVFSDEPNLTYYGILNGEHKFDDKNISLVDAELNFICLDPHKYLPLSSKSLAIDNSTIVTLNAAQGGAVYNVSNIEAVPIIDVTFKAAATEYKITHQESGKSVRIIYNFALNDHLIIDLNTRKITINNVVHMNAYDVVNSDPFLLKSGDNHFNILNPTLSNTILKYNMRFL